LQVLHRPQGWLDRAVVGDRVAAVVRGGAALKERHHVHVVRPELFEVIQAFGDAIQVTGEPVRVEDVADALLALKPVGG
jgi:hypothetical protein